jgi:hypothetical protein
LAAPPESTVLGFALSVTVGAFEFTETVADCVAVPPVPVQVSVNVEALVRAPVDCVPLTALAPLHAPEAVHCVAFVAAQFKVALPPLGTEVGPTLSSSVGAELFTVTVTVCDAVPPGPVQVKP